LRYRDYKVCNIVQRVPIDTIVFCKWNLPTRHACFWPISTPALYSSK